MTSDYKNKIQQDYEEIKEEIDVCLDIIKKESKLKVITHDKVEAKNEPFSIDFIPQSLEEAATFQDFLVDECLLRDIDMVDLTREKMRAKLQTILTHKSHLQNLALHLDQCTLDKGMCFVLLQWIPCILHMENRVGLKILHVVI